MKITIRKIAEIAGVSRGTVDKVVHNRPGVSDDVRARVRAIIETEGYQLPTRRRMSGTTGQDEISEQALYKLAVIFPRLTNPFFQAVQCGMEDTLKYYYLQEQVNIEYFYCDSSNIGEMLSVLDFIEERGTNGILLCGSDNQPLRDRLDHLADQEIPVVLFDADVPEARRLCLVGEDSFSAGCLAASLLAKSIGGSGDIATVSGLPDTPAHRARLQGFEQAVCERFPQIHIVETINSRGQGVIAYEKTRALIQENSELYGIFSAAGCTGDIVQALADQQAQHIKIVSYGFTDDIAALIKNGTVSFVIGAAPYQQGMEAMRIMMQYLCRGEEPAESVLKIPLLIGVEENIDALYHSQRL